MKSFTPVYSKEVTDLLTQLDEMIEQRIDICKKEYSYYENQRYFLERVKSEDILLQKLYEERVKIVALSIPKYYIVEE